ncbi:type II secretion system protein [Candidatus Pacearchaeota archaeon]|nr:type II secretion system protein [Candidatus Pacearchaeota archaeon]
MKTLRSKGKGFTLIEALEVMGIIAVIAAVLLPVIGARQAAHKANTPGAAAKVEAEFPEEKILTISAAEYCESVGRKLSGYRMVGVRRTYFSDSEFSRFQKDIPAGAEVVIGFMQNQAGYAGTALIPKDR